MTLETYFPVFRERFHKIQSTVVLDNFRSVNAYCFLIRKWLISLSLPLFLYLSVSPPLSLYIYSWEHIYPDLYYTRRALCYLQPIFAIGYLNIVSNMETLTTRHVQHMK